MMKEYIQRLLITAAVVIAVITYTLFLNSRLSIGRYEVMNIDYRAGKPSIMKIDRVTGKTWMWWYEGGSRLWTELPLDDEPSRQEQTSPPPKEQGKAEPPAVSDDEHKKRLSQLETLLAKRYPGKVQADCKDLASVVREIYPEVEGKVDDVTLATRALKRYPELRGRVRCDNAASAATKK